MDLKTIALGLILLSYNNDSSTAQFQAKTQKDIETETIIHRQLVDLSNNLDKNEKSLSLVKKYVHSEYIKLYNTSTIKEIRSICLRLQIEEEWFYKLLHFESGGNPQAVNKQKGDPKEPLLRIDKGRATSLIQFIPSTAKSLGTTTKDLYHMPILEQLPYIEKYIGKWLTKHDKFNSFLDLYLAVLYPSAINKGADFILGSEVSESRAKVIRNWNANIDKAGNNDGFLTPSDIASWQNKLI